MKRIIVLVNLLIFISCFAGCKSFINTNSNNTQTLSNNTSVVSKVEEKSPIVGKWKEKGANNTIEFYSNNTCKYIEIYDLEEERTVIGKYIFDKQTGKIDIIPNDDLPVDTYIATFQEEILKLEPYQNYGKRTLFYYKIN